MRKIFLLSALLLCVGIDSFAGGGEISRETLLYSVKGADSLRMDIISQGDDTGRPCLVFVFGGGFMSGNRDKKTYTQYFEYFAREGYVVASIDYRLGFKQLAAKSEKERKMGPVKMIKYFRYTVDIAVEDLFDATAYLVDNALQLGIDPAKIIVSGSSAGAVTALQGEYYICNSHELTSRLPEGFNYAGVASYAGAVLEFKSKLKWERNPCPVLLFHGDADSNVPYDKIRRLGIGFYGSHYIAGQLDAMGSPYQFWSYRNAAHEIAVDPMKKNLGEIMEFMNIFVTEGKPLQIETYCGVAGQPSVKKKFGIKDYVKSNFKD